MVKRKFRLTKFADFKRVRQFGKSFTHPLIVLVAHPNELGYARFAVAAGRTVGNAVTRNQAKRRIRAALQSQAASIQPGWDIVIFARRPIASSTFQQIQTGLDALLNKAKLLRTNDE